LLIYSFYARKNTVTPMLVGLGGVAVYLGTAVFLIGPVHLGLAGLILANTLQNSLHAIVLFGLLSRSVGSLSGQGIWITLGRAAIAGLAGVLLCYVLKAALPPPGGAIALLAYLVTAATLALLAYVALLSRLGVEEIGLARTALAVRLNRRKDGVAF